MIAIGLSRVSFLVFPFRSDCDTSHIRGALGSSLRRLNSILVAFSIVCGRGTVSGALEKAGRKRMARVWVCASMAEGPADQLLVREFLLRRLAAALSMLHLSWDKGVLSSSGRKSQDAKIWCRGKYIGQQLRTLRHGAGRSSIARSTVMLELDKNHQAGNHRNQNCTCSPKGEKLR